MIISKDEYDRQLRNEAIFNFVKNALELNMSDNEIIDRFEITPEKLEQIKEEYRKTRLNNQVEDKEQEK